MSDASLPSAPGLDGDIILDVFTHPSLRQEGGSGDNERYTVLGEQVFQAAITHAIFLRFPRFGKHEITEERKKQLSDENYVHWITYYRFREKLRYHPSASEEVHSLKGARELFHAYVGGAYTQTNGPVVVNTWVHNLIAPPEARIVPKQDPPFYHLPPPPPTAPYPMPPPPPPGFPSYPRSRTSSFSSGSGRQSVIAHEDANANYATTTTGKIVFLPRFNEICTQRRYNVQYPAEQGGLQHAPRWIVNCIVDGVQRGHGTATTKQLAKEEAAKQAWLSFGWSMQTLQLEPRLNTLVAIDLTSPERWSEAFHMAALLSKAKRI